MLPDVDNKLEAIDVTMLKHMPHPSKEMWKSCFKLSNLTISSFEMPLRFLGAIGPKLVKTPEKKARNIG